MSDHTVRFQLNGQEATVTAPARESLAHTIRDRLGATGTNIGCEQGFCGSCSVKLNGELVRSCLVLAVQAEGSEVETIESVADGYEDLHPVQAAFQDHHALQCGFCTPGFVLTAIDLLTKREDLDESEVRTALSGQLCRCTGFQGIVNAVLAADRSWERTTDMSAVSTETDAATAPDDSSRRDFLTTQVQQTGDPE